MIPRLGQKQRDRPREATAVGCEKFEDVVEYGGVRALAANDRQHPFEIVAKRRRVEVRLAGTNPIDVAAQGVDLAVMDDVAIGMGTRPARCRVRRVAGVDKGDRAFNRRIIEIDEEAPHLRRDQHSLVHNGACAHGANIEDLVVEGLLGHDPLLYHATADVELTLKVVSRGNAFRPPDESLADGRHASLCGVTEVMGVNWDVTPEQKG